MVNHYVTLPSLWWYVVFIWCKLVEGFALDLIGFVLWKHMLRNNKSDFHNHFFHNFSGIENVNIFILFSRYLPSSNSCSDLCWKDIFVKSNLIWRCGFIFHWLIYSLSLGTEGIIYICYATMLQLNKKADWPHGVVENLMFLEWTKPFISRANKRANSTCNKKQNKLIIFIFALFLLYIL